ncbi:Fe-S cluster biosynthesis and repair protein YggX [Fontimonas thermophila]|uniref:Probable Fe(2+)-trafficking protein n=1 Tax=Fontimonas thermophila TaxID=1076937 RepID=A0A1I2JFL1_9GAMM|nr:oxidative damage protection protein [Fontimonas thermophila]SFF51656.1 Fe-S cluster biosynthesis and repair protein YggX [Fontimonas thermophila]
MSRTVRCIKLGIEAPGLDRPPLPGPLGQRIYENVSKQAWQEWLAHQTRLINEYRLVLADPLARKFLTEEMQRYFFGDGQTTQTGYIPPQK